MSKDGQTMLLRVKATPGASKTEALGVRDGRLRVRIAAAPEDGRANAALIAFLAKQLGCPKNRIAIVVGEKSRLKTLALPAAAEKKLLEIAGAPSAGRCPPSPPLA